jgi:hypothetical protein
MRCERRSHLYISIRSFSFLLYDTDSEQAAGLPARLACPYCCARSLLPWGLVAVYTPTQSIYSFLKNHNNKNRAICTREKGVVAAVAAAG